MTTGVHPRLVFARDEVPALRRKAETPAGRAILARLRRLLRRADDRPDQADAGFHAAGHGLLYLLSDERSHADEARRLVELVRSDAVRHHGVALWRPGYKMIVRTDPAVGVALAYDLCHDAWDEAFRRDVAADLGDRARQFIRGGGKGWNPSPMSNWHANTRSAAGICALAVLGDPGAEGAEGSVRDAVRGLHNWMEGQIGDRGWTQEGLAYYRYPLTHHVLPFIQIYRNVVDADAFRGTAADWFGLFYVALLVPGAGEVPVVNPGDDRRCEPTRWRAGAFPLALGTVPPEKRPGFLWTYRQRHGPEGDGTLGIFLPHHALFALATWPDGLDPANPATVMDRVWADRKRGQFLLRNRWADADDFVACFDANVDPQRDTGKPVCSGGFAFTGLGTLWAGIAVPGGKSRRDYCVVEAPGMDEQGGGRITWFEPREDGSGVVTADLSAVYREGAIRSFAVDYGEASGTAALVAVVDRFASPVERVWRMHTRGRASAEPGGFTIRGERGATLRGTVVGPSAARVSVDGSTVEGRASGDGATAFFVVMTVQRGGPPAVGVKGEGLDASVTVGRRTVRFDGDRIVLGR